MGEKSVINKNLIITNLVKIKSTPPPHPAKNINVIRIQHNLQLLIKIGRSQKHKKQHMHTLNLSRELSSFSEQKKAKQKCNTETSLSLV